MAGEELAAAYTFDLPQELIAQHPAAQRDASRLMVVKCDGIEHRIFTDLPTLVRPGDLLVLNDTRVIAARIVGTRESSGGAVELLLLGPADARRYDPQATRWTALARPARRLHIGDVIRFGDFGSARITAIGEDGIREIDLDLHVPFEDFLDRAGRLPLPPYIHTDEREARERYQTIFARVPGSVAAPTASLHFTQRVLDAVRERGAELAYVTLDVGLGTFRPMKAPRLSDHVMHAERYDDPGRDCPSDRTHARAERARDRGGDDGRAHVGRLRRRSRRDRCGRGKHAALHHARLPLCRRRRDGDQFSLAAVDAARLGERLRRARAHPRCLSHRG